MKGFQLLQTVAGLFVLGVGLVASCHATPAFAEKEKQKCLYCHVVAGGDRNFRGLFYDAHKNSFADFDNEFEAKAAGVDAKSVGPDATPKNGDYPSVKVADALNFVLKDIDGKPIKLGRYEGKVVMVVNVASKCGYTPQYKALQAVFEKYKKKGLVVLGFPANQFGKQEPGTNKEIKEFCTENYKVGFPMFSKIVVKGEGINPFYKFLTDKETDEKFAGDIKWNFNKFLINRKGEVVGRFDSPIAPDSEEISKKLEELLAEGESVVDCKK